MKIKHKCGWEFHADRDHIGKSVRCGKCGKPIEIKEPIESWKVRVRRRYRSVFHVFADGSKRRILFWLVVVIGSIAFSFGAVGIQEWNRKEDSSGPQLTRSLPTGTFVHDPAGLTGSNDLTIMNGNSRDAVVKIVGKVVDVSVYVGAGTTGSVTNIAACVCIVVFDSGEDWDNENQKFTRNESSTIFNQSLVFETDHPKHYTISLNPTPKGTAKVHGLSKEQAEEQIRKSRSGR